MLKGCLICGALLFLCGIAITMIFAPDRKEMDRIEADSPHDAFRKVALDFTVERGYGNDFTVDLTMRNKSKFKLKDFVVGCDCRGNSGTVIATRIATVYEVLKPGEANKFRHVPFGFADPQTASVACYLASASAVQ